MSSDHIDTLFQTAKLAAQRAAEAQNAKLGDEYTRGFDCGFAWVTIQPARGPLVAYLKRNGIGKTGSYSGGSGYGIWYSELHTVATQSVSVHEAACREFCRVIQNAGYSASIGSRLD